MTGWYLIGLGRLPWPGIRDLCSGMTCAWADYDGFHRQQQPQLPDQAPPYSHVWAWGSDHAVRVRLDQDEGVVGVLTTNPNAWPGALLSEPVEVTERDAWQHQADATTIRLLEVAGPMPIAFVHQP